MDEFRAAELRRFLAAVDRHLRRRFELLIIGGSAAALAYDVSRATGDIDTWNADFTRISSALEAARKDTGLNIPVERPGVQDGPLEFESRLESVQIPGLEKLIVKVPEKHDLVLMKTVRGEEPDLQVAEEIKARHGLEAGTLVGRYVGEMKQIVGEPGRLDLNLLVLIRRLFGEQALESAKKQIERMHAPKSE